MNGCYTGLKNDISFINEKWANEMNKDSCYNVNLTKKSSNWMIG